MRRFFIVALVLALAVTACARKKDTAKIVSPEPSVATPKAVPLGSERIFVGNLEFTQEFKDALVFWNEPINLDKLCLQLMQYKKDGEDKGHVVEISVAACPANSTKVEESKIVKRLGVSGDLDSATLQTENTRGSSLNIGEINAIASAATLETHYYLKSLCSTFEEKCILESVSDTDLTFKQISIELELR